MPDRKPTSTPDLGHIDTWVFDLDNTLYPAACNLFHQVDQRIGAFVSRLLALPADQARVVQKGYLAKYGTTLRGLMVEHRLEPAEYLNFVHDIDVTKVPPHATPLEPNPERSRLTLTRPGARVGPSSVGRRRGPRRSSA